jgi:imidazolonepropionase
MAATELAVVHAAQLVTLAGPPGPRVGPEMGRVEIIRDGAVVVRDGTIRWVGETDRLPAFSGETVDATGCVVTPGFVDAHTHPVFGGTRMDEFEMRSRGASYEQIAAAGGGIVSTVQRTRALSAKGLLEVAIEHAGWMISGGTTTIEAKSGYGLSVDSEIRTLQAIRDLPEATGIRVVPTLLAAHAVPPEFEGRRAAYVREIVEVLIPRVAAEGLARFCDLFCEDGYFTAEDARVVMAAAMAHGLEPKLHADQLRNSGGAVLAAEIGAISADHLEYTDAAGIRAMKGAGVYPVLLPGSVYALGKTRYPDARSMIEAGLPVVIATDFNPGSSPTPSIPMVLSLACTQMRMSPAEAMNAVTVNAAYSLGLGAEIGSLEPGKRADLAIHHCSDYRELAYFFGFSRAAAVYCGGREATTRRGL